MRKKIAAAVLGITVLFAFFWAENNISRSYHKCVQAETDYQSANNPDKYRFIVGRIIQRQVVCTGQFADRHNGFIAALAAIAVASFTATLWWSTRRLWQETSAHAGHLENTVAIGRAQVRAYVSITNCSIGFLALAQTAPTVPAVEITATNSGQSPARRFLWNPTIEYIEVGEGASFTRRRSLTDRWEDDMRGMPIQAIGGTFSDRAIITDMTIQQIEAIAPQADTIIVRVNIDYRYADVFDDIWSEHAFFSGLLAKRDGDWAIRIDPMPRPRDWQQITENQAGA